MTNVVHGSQPRFQKTIKSTDSYEVTIKGYYTTEDHWTAAGVVSRKWNSQQATKRKPELLGLRSAFFDWFLLNWVKCGGSFEEGVGHLCGYPFENHRLRVANLDQFLPEEMG